MTTLQNMTMWKCIFILSFLLFHTLADDDYSPEEAVKLFPKNSFRLVSQTPPISHTTRNTMPLRNIDLERAYSIMNLDDNKLSRYDANNFTLLSRNFNPANIFEINVNSSSVGGKNCQNILNLNLRKGFLPVVIIILAIVGLVTNSFPLISFIFSKSLRNGHTLLLVNVVIADLLYICSILPLVSLHFTESQPYTPHVTACRLGHYMILVSVYVFMYILVVACLFVLMNGLCYNRPSDLIVSHGLKSQNIKSLSLISSGVLCLVVWLSFVLSHAHILFSTSNHLITSSIYQPFICRLPSQPNFDEAFWENYTKEQNEDEKVKTLWMTFLICAFLIPLITVLLISSFVIFTTKSLQRNKLNTYKNNYNSYENAHHKAALFYESIQNKKNNFKNKRDLAIVVMVTVIVKVLSWLPSFVVLFVASKLQKSEKNCDKFIVLQRFELIALCVTLTCCWVTPVVLFTLVPNFKHFIKNCNKKEKKTKTLMLGGITLNPALANRSSLLKHLNEGSKMNETIMSIISDSSNHINYLS